MDSEKRFIPKGADNPLFKQQRWPEHDEIASGLEEQMKDAGRKDPNSEQTYMAKVAYWTRMQSIALNGQGRKQAQDNMEAIQKYWADTHQG